MGDRPGGAAAGPVVLLVAAGGSVGAVLRSLVPDGAGLEGLPVGTLAVNASGSLLLGLLTGWLLVRSSRPWVRPLLGTGVLGGFTTYSTFATETVQRAASQPVVALGYVVLTVVLALGLAGAGLAAGGRLAGRQTPTGAAGAAGGAGTSGGGLP